MSDNYFDKMTFKLEFTPEEVTKLIWAVILSKLDDEQYIKNYPNDKELIEKLNKELDVYETILVKLRQTK